MTIVKCNGFIITVIARDVRGVLHGLGVSDKPTRGHGPDREATHHGPAIG
jgi:hypothetical protein